MLRTRFGPVGLAVLLALVGSALNDLPVPLGWGLHLVLGSAVVWAGMRVIGPWLTVAALSAVAAQTILLWHHPWAWLIWTLEAATVAFLHKRDSPVVVDLGFWAVLGSPLLAITYGLVMGMDWLSVGLVIVKQVYNGVLCVILGELLYVLSAELARRLAWADLPRIPFRAMAIALLMAFVVFPAGIQTYLHAEGSFEAVSRDFDRRLEDAMKLGRSILDNWVNERVNALRRLVTIAQGGIATCDTSPSGTIGDERYWITPLHSPCAREHPYSSSSAELGRGYLSDMHTTSAVGSPHVELALVEGRPPILIYSEILPRVLDALFVEALNENGLGLALLDRTGHPVLSHWPSTVEIPVREQVLSLVASSDEFGPTLVTSRGFGRSLMIDYKAAVMVRAVSLGGAAYGWRLAVVLTPREAVLAERRAQFRELSVILGIILIAAIGAWVVARSGDSMIRGLYESLAELPSAGSSGRVPRLMGIEEMNAIQIAVTRAAAVLDEDRSLIGAYERQLRLVEAHAPIALYCLAIVDGQRGPLTYVSSSASRLFGSDPEEIVQPGWWRSNIHPEDLAGFRSAFALLAPGQVVSHEYRLRRSDGTYAWVYDTLIANADTSSEETTAIGVLLNISRRKEAEIQLVQSAKLASLGEMATGMAHELNQPLNVIKMAAANMLRRIRAGSSDPSDLMHRLTRIVEQTDRASSLIGHLRIFGRRPDGARSVFPIRDAVDGALSLIGRQVALAKIHLAAEELERNLKVSGFQTLLEQVVLNLVLNARDAIEANAGPDGSAERWIRIVLGRENESAKLVVEDSGGGIADDIIGRVFEPFFTTKPPQSGTGLGLSVTYGIVRDMQGTIDAENMEHGARFTVRIPLANEMVRDVGP